MTPSSWTEEQIAYFALANFVGFGNKRLKRLFHLFGSWKIAWAAPIPRLLQTGISEQILSNFLSWRRTFDLTNTLAQLAGESIQVLLPDDPAFPHILEQSADPPALLYVRGTLSPVPSIAIVGTRKPTSYGSQCVDTLVPPLCDAGFATVSGLALGVDGLVHTRTISSRGTTVAFVGSGVDDASLYPATHLHLAHDILSHGGAIVSELPLGTKARKEHFPQRNRLIATYSCATVVIEAAEKSGSLITAKLALEENREVFSVPGPIWSSQSRGTNNLLRSGAHVCTCVQDIFDGLHLDRPDLVTKAQATFPLDPLETRVLELLIEPRHQDELGRLLECSSAAISSVMTMLELKGCISCLGGNTWVKTRLPT